MHRFVLHVVAVRHFFLVITSTPPANITSTTIHSSLLPAQQPSQQPLLQPHPSPTSRALPYTYPSYTIPQWHELNGALPPITHIRSPPILTCEAYRGRNFYTNKAGSCAQNKGT